LAISKEKKKQILAGYIDNMSKSQALILTDYRGLSVADITELRQKLREDKGKLQVVKNTLFKLALEETGTSIPPEQLQGTIAVGYCLEEVPPVAKILMDFAKQSNILEVRGALLGESFLDANGVKNLADLPPREVLMAQLVGAFQGPASSLASTLIAPLRELTQVLQARAEQGEDGQPAEVAA
jgi:large subunit ribosomal protein L10